MFNEAFRSLNHKTCFSFALKCLNGQNSRVKLKSYRHFRAKLKHVLWLGLEHFKTSLRNSSEKLIYNMPSSLLLIMTFTYLGHMLILRCKAYLHFSKIQPESQRLSIFFGSDDTHTNLATWSAYERDSRPSLSVYMVWKLV